MLFHRREGVERHSVFDFLGVGLGPLGHCLDLRRLGRPAARRAAHFVVGAVQRFDERHHKALVFSRPFAVDDDAFKGWEALFANAARGGQHFAVALDLAQNRVPDKGGVNVATLPSGGDFGRAHIHHVDGARVHAFELHVDHQLVMRGGDKRCRDALAFEVLDAVHARAVAGHQRFGVTDVGRDPEQLDVLALAGGSRQWAGAGFAHLHIAGSHTANHVATAREHAPVDHRTPSPGATEPACPGVQKSPLCCPARTPFRSMSSLQSIAISAIWMSVS